MSALCLCPVSSWRYESNIKNRADTQVRPYKTIVLSPFGPFSTGLSRGVGGVVFLAPRTGAASDRRRGLSATVTSWRYGNIFVPPPASAAFAAQLPAFGVIAPARVRVWWRSGQAPRSGGAGGPRTQTPSFPGRRTLRHGGCWKTLLVRGQKQPPYPPLSGGYEKAAPAAVEGVLLFLVPPTRGV